MLAIRNVSRYRAASYHLAISAGIAAITLTVMLALWYPSPLFAAMGGMQLIALIVGVDVAIGPLITLVIFDTRKKELLVDLMVIALLQVAALGYGVYAMSLGRPVFMVATDLGIRVVPAVEIDDEELAKAQRDEFRRRPLTGPLLVAVQEPSDRNERSNIAFAALAGKGIQNLPRYFVPYAEKRTEVVKTSRPLTDLDLGAEDLARLDAYLQRVGRKAEELRCLPVTTKRGLLTAILNENGDVLELLAIRPDLRQAQIGIGGSH